MTRPKIGRTLPTVRSSAKVTIRENYTLYTEPICGHAEIETYEDGKFQRATYPRLIWVNDDLSRYQVPICFDCLLNELNYINEKRGG